MAGPPPRGEAAVRLPRRCSVAVLGDGRPWAGAVRGAPLPVSALTASAADDSAPACSAHLARGAAARRPSLDQRGEHSPA
ncbi:hypothetical protein AB4Z54_51980, partial [Streptomyces sp. MCAF7]